MLMTPALLVLLAASLPLDPPCLLPSSPCPTDLGEGAFFYDEEDPIPEPPVVPDRRPVVRFTTWNGTWTNTGGWSDWWDQPDAVVVPHPSGTGTSCVPEGVAELVARMQEAHDRGFRRMVLMLPGGSVQNQAMSSSQYGGLPGTYRAALNGYVKAWLTARAGETDGEVTLGIYTGFPLAEDSCDLDMTGSHLPDMTAQADAEQMLNNIAPWITIGVREVWLDESSANAATVAQLNGSPDYTDLADDTSLRFGGEAIAFTATGPNCGITVDYSALLQAPWVCQMQFAETRFGGVGLDVWAGGSLDPLDTELGVWLEDTTAACSRSATTLTLARARMLHDLGWVLWGTESARAVSQGADYHFYTGMELMQRVYDFGMVSAGADFNCDATVNGADYMDAYAVITANMNDINVGYMEGDFDNDNVITSADWDMFEDMYDEFVNYGLYIPLYLGDHP